MADSNQKNKEEIEKIPLIDRELSWLDFNTRVLAEGTRSETPLQEKLKFLSIYNSNLDEFFMVRVAGLKQLFEEKIITVQYPTPESALATLQEIRSKILQSNKQYDQLLDSTLKELKKKQVEVCSYDKVDPEDQKYLNKFFQLNIFPALTPLAFDTSHPAPYLNNLDIYLVIKFKNMNETSLEDLIAFVQIPAILPRLIKLPSAPEKTRFVRIEDIIKNNLNKLFKGFVPESAGLCRVSRNLDYTLLESEVVDLLSAMQKEVINKLPNNCVRLQIEEGTNESIIETLKKILDVKDEDIYQVKSLLGSKALMTMYACYIPEGKDVPFNPRIPKEFSGREDIFALLDKQDIMLHHPYDSFYPVIELLFTAANNSDVIAIKQTLYRTSGDSKIIQALIEAAQRGIQVTAVIELKARFDEKNNIKWANQLERAGVNVVYGFVSLKTHAKATLIIKKKNKKLRLYSHLSTGNYNSSTARFYTDIGLMTADKKICEDISQLFNLLTGFNIFSGGVAELKQSVIPKLSKISIAPIGLRQKILELVDQEAAKAQAGKPAFIVAKMNALVDPKIIRHLYLASQAGVQIKLLIRGICCLIPGIPKISDNIEVISIIDRFLEHSRIFCFGKQPDLKIFISSADWMTRNMDRRVETFIPIEAPELQEDLIQTLNTYLNDNQRSWLLNKHGEYLPRPHNGQTQPIRSQQILIDKARKEGLQSIPYDQAIKSKKGKKRRSVLKKKN